MTTSSPHNPELFDLARLTSLIDGVFSVALTLLVLDLKLPSGSADLPHALVEMLPSLVVYLITFASVAGYWTIHHGTFRHVREGDGRFIVLSLLNLLFITLFPVTASIVGAHPLDPIAMACLSTNSLLYCLSSWALWSHAAAKPQLLVEEDDQRTLERVARIMMLVGLGLALAIPLAFLSGYLAYALWIVWPPVWALRVHRGWKGPA